MIDTLAHHFDEPFADASALPTYRVCELAREQVTVALSGDGADEALAGYRRHVFHRKEEQLRGLLPQGLRGPLFGGLGKLYPKADWAPRPLRAKTTLLSLARNGPEGYTDAVSLTNPAQRHGLYSQRMRGIIGGYRAEDHMERLMAGAPAQSGLDQAQYADMKLWLPGDVLTKVDRMSMAVSLGGARATTRPPAARIRCQPARADADSRRAGQMADEADDGALSTQRHPLPPENGIRDAY